VPLHDPAEEFHAPQARKRKEMAEGFFVQQLARGERLARLIVGRLQDDDRIRRSHAQVHGNGRTVEPQGEAYRPSARCEILQCAGVEAPLRALRGNRRTLLQLPATALQTRIVGEHGGHAFGVRGDLNSQRMAFAFDLAALLAQVLAQILAACLPELLERTVEVQVHPGGAYVIQRLQPAGASQAGMHVRVLLGEREHRDRPREGPTQGLQSRLQVEARRHEPRPEG